MVIERKLSCMNLPWPVDWAALFGAERPLIVEIGFGNADHLLHLAQTHPDCNVVGIEIASQSMQKAERKIRKGGLDNAAAIHGLAETALHHLMGPASVRAFHINYPDPWFKTRHAGRRLIQRDTLDALVSRLEIGGLLHLATDIRAYAEMAHGLLQETPGLDNTLDAPWVHELPGRFVTKYEEKGLREGRPGHYFIYRRSDQPAPPVPVMREWPMPHIILETPDTPDDIARKFEKGNHDAGDGIHVVWTNAFINPQTRLILFEVTITEPTIEQHVGLLLFPRDEPDAYTLRYSTMGQPRATAGLHRATDALADWIVGLHPQARIRKRLTQRSP